MRSRPRSRSDFRFRTPPVSALTQALPRAYNVVMAFFTAAVSTSLLVIVHDGLMTGDEAIWNAGNFLDLSIDGTPAVVLGIFDTGTQFVILSMQDPLTVGQLLSFNLDHPDSRRFPAAPLVNLPIDQVG